MTCRQSRVEEKTGAAIFERFYLMCRGKADGGGVFGDIAQLSTVCLTLSVVVKATVVGFTAECLRLHCNACGTVSRRRHRFEVEGKRCIGCRSEKA